MAIDRLGSTGHLLAALRAEVARKSERRNDRSDAGQAVDAPAGDPSPPRDLNALRRELAEIARGVPASDPDALDAVRPRMIRAVLLWEFGAGLREHNDWQAMLDAIVDTLQNDPRQREQFGRLVRDLQR